MTETLGDAITAAEEQLTAETTTPDTIPVEESPEIIHVTDGIDAEPTNDSQETEIPVEQQAIEEDKTPASVNKRLNKMHAEKRAAEERALALEQRLMQMSGVSQQSNVAQHDPYAPREPAENDPKYANNYRAYIKDCVQYERDCLIYNSQKHQAQQQQTRLVNEHTKRIQEAHSRYSDYEEKVGNLNSIPVSPNNPTVAALSSTLMALDNSADVMYYLGNNIEECEKLLAKDAYSAAVYLGKISARLDVAPGVQKSNTPAPPRKIVGKGSTTNPTGWNNISIDDLAKRLRQTY